MDLSKLDYEDVEVNTQPASDTGWCPNDEAKRYGNNKAHRTIAKRKIQNKLAKASKKISRKQKGKK